MGLGPILDLDANADAAARCVYTLTERERIQVLLLILPRARTVNFLNIQCRASWPTSLDHRDDNDPDFNLDQGLSFLCICQLIQNFEIENEIPNEVDRKRKWFPRLKFHCICNVISALIYRDMIVDEYNTHGWH